MKYFLDVDNKVKWKGIFAVLPLTGAYIKQLACKAH